MRRLLVILAVVVSLTGAYLAAGAVAWATTTQVSDACMALHGDQTPSTFTATWGSAARGNLRTVDAAPYRFAARPRCRSRAGRPGSRSAGGGRHPPIPVPARSSSCTAATPVATTRSSCCRPAWSALRGSESCWSTSATTAPPARPTATGRAAWTSRRTSSAHGSGSASWLPRAQHRPARALDGCVGVGLRARRRARGGGRLARQLVRGPAVRRRGDRGPRPEGVRARSAAHGAAHLRRGPAGRQPRTRARGAPRGPAGRDRPRRGRRDGPARTERELAAGPPAAARPTEVWVVGGAGHVESAFVQTAEYARRVAAFCRSHLAPRARRGPPRDGCRMRHRAYLAEPVAGRGSPDRRDRQSKDQPSVLRVRCCGAPACGGRRSCGCAPAMT